MTSGQEEEIACAAKDLFSQKKKNASVSELQRLCKIRVIEKSEDHTVQERVSQL